jgi:pilus assembly protein Flp/PilA
LLHQLSFRPDAVEHLQQQGAQSELLVRFLKDESAATAIEYGLIAAGISLAITAVVSNLGTKLKSSFTSISTQLK